jgi:hypothetical protein
MCSSLPSIELERLIAVERQYIAVTPNNKNPALHIPLSEFKGRFACADAHGP